MKSLDVPEVVPAPPRLIQIISHAGDIYALNDRGDMFRRERDPKDLNQGPHNKGPVFLWHPVPGPDAPRE